jgi:hypothetical protein
MTSSADPIHSANDAMMQVFNANFLWPAFLIVIALGCLAIALEILKIVVRRTFGNSKTRRKK